MGPEEIRWTPRQHYDAAAVLVSAEPTQENLLRAIDHTLMGILQVMIAEREQR